MNKVFPVTTSKYASEVVAVANELVKYPDLSSKEIARKIGITREKLLKCYDTIQANLELQNIVINKSSYPRLTKSTAELFSGYGKYLSEILSGVKVYPLILEFHPGPACQCHCKFCFSDGYDYGEIKNGGKPISSARLEAIFQECRENGVEEVWFSGGKEPFVNPQTPDYILMASKLGFRTRLYTNGISMTRKVQEIILNCYQIRISVNGAKPGTFGRIQFPKYTATNMEGLFNCVLSNIANLVQLKKERNKSVRIGMSQILQPDNHDEMIEFTELACRLGVDAVHFRLEAMGVIRDFTPREKETVYKQVKALRSQDWGIEIDVRGVEEGEFESRENQFLPGLRRPNFCRAGLLKRGLNPYGALYNCEFSSHPRFGSVSDHLRIGDATKESVGDLLRRYAGRYPPPCRLCQAHEYGLNITLERLESDLSYGIPIEKQPYFIIRDNSSPPTNVNRELTI